MKRKQRQKLQQQIKIVSLQKPWLNPEMGSSPGFWIQYNHEETPCVFLENFDCIEVSDGYSITQLNDMIDFLQNARKVLKDGIQHR